MVNAGPRILTTAEAVVEGNQATITLDGDKPGSLVKVLSEKASIDQSLAMRIVTPALDRLEDLSPSISNTVFSTVSDILLSALGPLGAVKRAWDDAQAREFGRRLQDALERIAYVLRVVIQGQNNLESAMRSRLTQDGLRKASDATTSDELEAARKVFSLAIYATNESDLEYARIILELKHLSLVALKHLGYWSDLTAFPETDAFQPSYLAMSMDIDETDVVLATAPLQGHGLVASGIDSGTFHLTGAGQKAIALMLPFEEDS